MKDANSAPTRDSVAAGPRRFTILSATDGSRAGTAAVRFAARLASCESSSELIVVTVGHGSLDSRHVLDGARRRFRAHAGRIRFENIDAETYAEVPDAISRAADRIRADLIVVGSEGRETLQEWVVGGTALRLIYISRRPVTVVRATGRRRHLALAKRATAARHISHH